MGRGKSYPRLTVCLGYLLGARLCVRDIAGYDGYVYYLQVVSWSVIPHHREAMRLNGCDCPSLLH